MTRRIAAFDFDGTVTERDTLLGFLVHTAGRARVAALGVRHLPEMVRGLSDDEARDSSKTAIVTGALKGLTPAELEDAGRLYASTLPSRFRPETVSRINSHRSEGHELVMVSASLVYYLEPTAQELGFSHVIGVELATGAGGTVGPEHGLSGPNVRGPEKERRLREWLAETSPDRTDGAEIWAYGNSAGDDELLAMADHSTWVGKRAG